MIIVLKDKNSVWVAGSIECTYNGFHNDDIISEDNLKMWCPIGTKNCVMASTTPGSPLIDVLRYSHINGLDLPLDNDIVINTVAPFIKESYQSCDLLDDGHLWNSFVIAKDDRAFSITPNFTVCEIEDFEMLGYDSSKDVAYGALEMTHGLPPIERIAETFRVVEKSGDSKHFPIVVMNTKTHGRVVIER